MKCTSIFFFLTVPIPLHTVGENQPMTVWARPEYHLCGSILWPKRMFCQWEAKLKQDVQAPCFFEGVPHHTSDSEETQSTTIKGHSVYLNLPSSVRQMFESFSFISSPKPYFPSNSKFVTLHYAWMGKEEKSTFSCWREKRLNLNIV